MEGGQAGFVLRAGFDDAEEVLDSVDIVGAEEGVPFHVEEQVAWGGVRKDEQPLVLDQLALAVARGWDAFRQHDPVLLTLHLDAGLGLDSLERFPSYAVQSFG